MVVWLDTPKAQAERLSSRRNAPQFEEIPVISWYNIKL